MRSKIRLPPQQVDSLILLAMGRITNLHMQLTSCLLLDLIITRGN